MRIRDHNCRWTSVFSLLLWIQSSRSESGFICKKVEVSPGIEPYFCTPRAFYALNFDDAIDFCARVNGNLARHDNHADMRDYPQRVMKRFKDVRPSWTVWNGRNENLPQGGRCETAQILTDGMFKVNSDCSTLTQFICECGNFECKDSGWITSALGRGLSQTSHELALTTPLPPTTLQDRNGATEGSGLTKAPQNTTTVAIVGGVVGGISLLVVGTLVAGFILCRRRYTRKNTRQTYSTDILQENGDVESTHHQGNGELGSNENPYAEIEDISHPDKVNIRLRGATDLQSVGLHSSVTTDMNTSHDAPIMVDRNTRHGVTVGAGTHLYDTTYDATFQQSEKKDAPLIADQNISQDATPTDGGHLYADIGQVPARHNSKPTSDNVTGNDIEAVYAKVDKSIHDDLLLVENDQYASYDL